MAERSASVGTQRQPADISAQPPIGANAAPLDCKRAVRAALLQPGGANENVLSDDKLVIKLKTIESEKMLEIRTGRDVLISELKIQLEAPFGFERTAPTHSPKTQPQHTAPAHSPNNTAPTTQPQQQSPNTHSPNTHSPNNTAPTHTALTHSPNTQPQQHSPNNTAPTTQP